MQYDLNNLPFDPAQEANKPSTHSAKQSEQETEEDGLREGALRLLKVRHQFRALTGRTHGLLPLPSDTQETKAST